MKKHGSKQVISIVAILCMLSVLTTGLLVRGSLKSSETNTEHRLLQGSPKQILHNAILNTQDQLQQERGLIEEKSGGSILTSIFETQALDMSMNVKLKALKGTENEDTLNAMLKDISLEGGLLATKDGAHLKSDLTIKQGVLELLQATFYKNNGEFGVYSPKILDNPYAFKGETFFEDLKKSAFYPLVRGETSNERVLEDLSSIVECIRDSAYKEKSNKVYENMIKQLEVVELGKTETNETIYVCTLKSEQLAALSKEQMTLIMELDFAGNMPDRLAKYLGMSKEAFLEKVMNERSYEGLSLQFEFHVDDSFIRLVTCTMKSDTYNEDILMISFELKDEKSLLGERQWKIQVGEGIDLKVVSRNTVEGEQNKFETNLNIELTSYGEKGFVNYQTVYDRGAKDNPYKINVEAELPYIGSAVIVGEGSKVVSEDQVAVTLENLICQLTDADDKEIQASLALDYGIKGTSVEEAEFKSKEPVKYILDLSQEALTEVLQKVQAHLGGIEINFR